ncbi:hypothetical protein SAMN04488543_2697 [Friedmanniella luteola]|uniref:Uncharacterized protein n=1 Tax=Friedmanniella luteola TaxID=546871 RepID=A0A1H1WEX0_9ACTN|nr:hypothetical protein [Friedmanniella luteola]SDS94699.1 hypothetical protein SAMN04488543_2697 [Friedmanniella luteola]
MDNKYRIKPTRRSFVQGESVSFEVNLKEEYGGNFVWAILTSEGDQTKTVKEQLVKRGGKDDPHTYAIPVGGLAPGSYHLVLRTWQPAGGHAGAGGALETSAEHAFSVIQDVGERIQLVNEAALGHPEAERPFATFPGFTTFLKEQGLNFKKKGRFFGAFGENNYQELKRLALQYVQDKHCDSLDELIPDGYLRARMEAEPLLPGKFYDKHFMPCVELIWNYWLEEGMLVQTLNVILARFQNRRLGSDRDPLARFDITPLLPLRNLLWGWAEDEHQRLTLRRRAAEYEYEYGLTLIGRAVPPTRMLVERRTGFLESFHQILHQAHIYFKESDDLTVNADPFPLYRSLRECHLIVSQGSHNQYGEMAVTARADFLTMQTLLAQPPMREFLGGRPMTPYPEDWMDRVDTMKGLQGWTDTSIMHHHDLATLGERLVLTIRLGDWAGTNVGAQDARVWANAFRPAIQKYVAAYRAVTGVDLSKDLDTTMPSTLILRRLRSQRQRA